MNKRFVAIVAFAMIAVLSFAQSASPELVSAGDTVREDGTVQVPIIVRGASQVCALQFSMLMPDSVSLDNGPDGTAAVQKGAICTDHFVDYNMNVVYLNVACMSITNSVFASDSGTVCLLNLKIGKEIKTDMVLLFAGIEMSTPGVQSIEQGYATFTVYPRKEVQPDTIPAIVPDIHFGIEPFTFNGALQSALTIVSNMDISSISFRIKVPENLGVNRLVSLFGYMLATDFRTDITPVDLYTYDVSVSAINDSLITAGVTAITGISVQYVMGLITPGVYTFSLDNINVTGADGRKYVIEPQVYNVNIGTTQVEALQNGADEEPVSYFTLDGREVPGPVKGVTLVRHADGRVTKLINR